MTKYLSVLQTVGHGQTLPIVWKDYVATSRSFGGTINMRFFLVFSSIPCIFPFIFRLFPITQPVVWKTATGLQMCLKQDLHDHN